MFYFIFCSLFFPWIKLCFWRKCNDCLFKIISKTLIAGWSSGTGLSGIISGGLNLLTQLLNGLSLKFLYLILTPVGPVYLFLFLWTFKLLKKIKML